MNKKIEKLKLRLISSIFATFFSTYSTVVSENQTGNAWGSPWSVNFSVGITVFNVCQQPFLCKVWNQASPENSSLACATPVCFAQPGCCEINCTDLSITSLIKILGDCTIIKLWTGYKRSGQHFWPGYAMYSNRSKHILLVSQIGHVDLRTYW